MSDRRFEVFAMTHKRPSEAGDYILKLEAVIDAARAVANSYYGTEIEEFEPIVDALADALAALRKNHTTTNPKD